MLPAILGAAEAAVGLINKIKSGDSAKELAKSRSNYKISSDAKDELSLAESELGKGMSSRAERAYTNLEGSDFANSLDAILKSGGSANNIGTLYGTNQGGRERLALMEDEIRSRNLNNLIMARRNMTEQKDKAFEFNEWMPWADRAQATSAARFGADKQIWEGLSGAAQGYMNWDQNRKEQKMWNDYLNPPQPLQTSVPQFDYGAPTQNTAADNPIQLIPNANKPVDIAWQDTLDIWGNGGFNPQKPYGY